MGRHLWSALRTKLATYTRTLKLWPYNTSEVLGRSAREAELDAALARCRRHPDSRFSIVWDSLSALALVYTAFAVPFAVGFSHMPTLWSRRPRGDAAIAAETDSNGSKMTA